MNYELKTLKRGDVVTGTILSVKEKEKNSDEIQC